MTRLDDGNTSGVQGGQEVADTENSGQSEGGGHFGRQANKGILAKAVADELDVPRRSAARILDAVLDSVRDLLRDQGRVAIKGFGTFERKIRKGRAYKHPLTGKSIEVADKETILFKPSDQLILETRTDAATRAQTKKSRPTSDDVLFKG